MKCIVELDFPGLEIEVREVKRIIERAFDKRGIVCEAGDGDE